MPNLLTAKQLKTYQFDRYLWPFSAFPAAVAQSYHQKPLDFEHEIGDDPMNVLRIKAQRADATS